MYRPFEKFQLKGNFISVIGSGGKTSFLRYFASHLEGRVILTTSTHIYPFPDMPLVKTGTENSPVSREQILQEIRSALARSRVICLGQPLSNESLLKLFLLRLIMFLWKPMVRQGIPLRHTGLSNRSFRPAPP